MINFKEQNISVMGYCLHHTAVGDMVDIYDSGYYVASCTIDSEDLFARNLRGDYTKEYIDSVEAYERVVTDKDSSGQVHTHKCTYHQVNIGWSKTNFKKFRVRMSTERGVLYTNWYTDDIPDAFRKMYDESDKMLGNINNWSRDVEYERIFNE